MMMKRLIATQSMRNQFLRVCGVRSGLGAVRLSATPSPVVGPTRPCRRPFASDTATALLDILTREHAEEIDNNTTTMPPDLVDLKEAIAPDWKIVDEGAMTRLHKTLGPLKVQVSFHCQDTVETEPEYEQEEDEDEPVVDDEEAVPVRFTVTLTKAGKTMVLTCLTNTLDLSVSIQSTAMTTSSVDSILQEGGSVPSTDYQGPEFTELAEDLQDANHNYLVEDVGISESLVSFISMYCDYKEQTQYVHFLEDAKSLLS